MSTASIAPAASPREGGVPSADRIVYGAVHLDVVDVERSLPFWRDAVGLHVLPSPAAETRLGVPGRPLIVLHPGARFPVSPGDAGLYHVAVHVPDAVEFARVIARLQLARVQQAPTDHVFSKATYVRDPDGIMLELTLETPEYYGSVEIGSSGVVLRDNEGRLRNPTEPLDLTAALRPLADHDPLEPLAGGTMVGHVHLHVPNLQSAYGFYRDVVGFEEHAYMEAIGMADLSAGGPFPHRLALNNWQGANARQPRPQTAGLRYFELVLPDEVALAALAERASAAGISIDSAGDASLALRDPAGNAIAARAAASTLEVR